MRWLALLGLLGAALGKRRCESELLWDVHSYLSPSLGWDIQLCCGVEAIWAAELAPGVGWSLRPPVLDSVPVSQLSQPGSEFILSVCTDGSVSQGYVANRRGLSCSHKTGRVLRLLPRREGLQDNAWYVLCYAGASCDTCRLHRLCSSVWAPDCAAIWLERAVVGVRNDSLTVLLRIGARLPFPGASLSLSVLDRNGTEALGTAIADLRGGANYSVPVDGIRPDSWYRLRTCLHFRIPQAFLDANPNVALAPDQTKCLDDESYRTLSPRSSAANGQRESALSLTALLFALQYFR